MWWQLATGWNPATGLSAGTLTITANVPVTGITLAGPDKGTVGNPITITATIQPTNATDKKDIVWGLEYTPKGGTVQSKNDWLVTYGTTTNSLGVSTLVFKPSELGMVGSYKFSAKTAVGTHDETYYHQVEISIPTDQNFQYFEESSDGVAIVKYTGSLTTVNIPSTLGSKPVYLIGPGAFDANLVSVEIPASVLGICSSAFVVGDNSALNSVKFNRANVELSAKSAPTQPSFPGDLDAKYKLNGAGTYTREKTDGVWGGWVKQP